MPIQQQLKRADAGLIAREEICYCFFCHEQTKQVFFYVMNGMSNLKTMVTDLFEQDQQVRTIEKEIKMKTAQYNHLLMKNPDKVYTDAEMLAINVLHEELCLLRAEQDAILNNSNELKNQLKSFILPLNGGRWLHATDDIMHPNWEFWLEDDELKYAKLNGRNY
jgi:hypothetical protein